MEEGWKKDGDKEIRRNVTIGRKWGGCVGWFGLVWVECKR